MSRKKMRKSRSKTGRPKNSYPLPTGELVVLGKPTTLKNGRQVRVRGVMRKDVDVEALAAALLEVSRQDSAES